jgi:tRNA nucleotidyltransferase/poly(A) polymerase
MEKLLKFATLFSIAAEELDMNISFNSTEQKLFSLLKNVVKEKSPDTTLRIAGGYVRDKLLGKNSNDIDIAVDNMTGEQFANLVTQYMKENEMQTGNVSVVEANPDQSKHLATAMVKIFGLPIDFVNLRTETYSDSRIPTMQFGTAEEDAQRRDLTINSIFYNINTGKIEDFVGGARDLQNRIARTPMNPVQTFLDDPLRILRTIRFAARYGLTLDSSIIDAAHRPDVRQAFLDKISQERIWTELAGKKEGDHYKPGALIGENPTRAVELLKQLGLLELIFDPKSEELSELNMDKEMVPWETEQNNPHHKFDIWNHTLNVVKNLVDQTQGDIKEDQETYLIRNIAALLHDIGKRYTGIHGTNDAGFTNYHGHEETSAKLAEKILSRLRAPKNIIDRVVALIDNHLRPHQLLDNGSGKSYRRYVRDMPDWKHSVDLAIADNLGKENFSPEQIEIEKQKYEDLRSKIQSSLPENIGTGGKGNVIPRPITGKDLLQAGFLPGPKMGEVLKAIDEALLENPSLTKEEALEIAQNFR